jgi:hypothetical protein
MEPDGIFSMFTTAQQWTLLLQLLLLEKRRFFVRQGDPIYLSAWRSYISIYLWLYSPCWTFAAFSVSWPFLHSRQDSLNGGSALRKAATCSQDSTNTE